MYIWIEFGFQYNYHFPLENHIKENESMSDDFKRRVFFRIQQKKKNPNVQSFFMVFAYLSHTESNKMKLKLFKHLKIYQRAIMSSPTDF
jgi:hypothetical protein